MNGCVIAVDEYIGNLSAKTMHVSDKIGKVSVDMGGTACKVLYAPDYIQKMFDRRSTSKKKAVRC